MTRTLFVVATHNIDPANLHSDDHDVPGVYLVEGIDYSVPNEDAADIALASFHAHQGVKILDDFQFSVLDPVNKIALVANYAEDREELDCTKLQETLDGWMEAAIDGDQHAT